MAWSSLEKLMAAVIGIDLVAPGTSRKALEAALARVAPAAAAPKPVTPAPVGFWGPAAAVTGGTFTALAAMEQAAREREATKNFMVPIPGINPLLMDMPTVEVPVERRKVRKKLSKYNKAVKEGMKAVRSSTSYGKKGTINNAKKAFAAVNKVASKVNRGKKVSSKGITGRIARAVRRKL
tara:strand:- start:586 stop:1125 length:540 start_codon:yes stop_codon:yes gene_type:complete